MGLLVHSFWFIVHRKKIKKSTDSQLQAKRTINRKSEGFTLIELLVVISLFGIIASLITASYLTFERNQRIKNAAFQLKSDLRLAQNKALSGDKGSDGKCGRFGFADASTLVLVGWYISITPGANNYSLAGSCQQLGSSVPISPDPPRTVNLPKNIRVNAIRYGASSSNAVNILYRPLSQGVTFHVPGLTPPFLNSLDQLDNYYGSVPPQQEITIEFLLEDTSQLYQVRVSPSGEVNEKKP